MKIIFTLLLIFFSTVPLFCQIDTLLKRNFELNNQLGQCLRDVGNLEIQAVDMQENIDILKDEITRINIQVNTPNNNVNPSDLDYCNTEKERIQNNLNRCRSNLNRVERVNEGLDERVDNLIVENNNYYREKTRLELDTINLGNTIKALKKANERLQKDKKELKDKLDAAKKENDSLEEKIEELEDDIENLTDDLNEAHNMVSFFSTTIIAKYKRPFKKRVIDVDLLSNKYNEEGYKRKRIKSINVKFSFYAKQSSGGLTPKLTISNKKNKNVILVNDEAIEISGTTRSSQKFYLYSKNVNFDIENYGLFNAFANIFRKKDKKKYSTFDKDSDYEIRIEISNLTKEEVKPKFLNNHEKRFFKIR